MTNDVKNYVYCFNLYERHYQHLTVQALVKLFSAKRAVEVVVVKIYDGLQKAEKGDEM